MPLALAVHEISRHFWAAYDIIQLKQAATMVTKYLLKRKKMYNNEATARNHYNLQSSRNIFTKNLYWRYFHHHDVNSFQTTAHLKKKAILAIKLNSFNN